MRRVLFVVSAGMALGLVLPESVPDLCVRSDAAVLGEVTTVESRWTTDGRLETSAWIAVQELVLGAVPGDTVEVRWTGGRVGDLALAVEDEPELEPDRRYLLLLEARRDGSYAVTGGERGAIAVPHGDDGRAARRALGGCADAR